jgi:DNA (cytosine-5)-methyltransferase 1
VFFVGYAEHNGLSTAKVSRSIDAAGHNSEKGQNETGEFTGAGVTRSNEDVADTERVYVQGQHNRQEQGQLRGSCRRAVESRLGGMANGIPYWLDGYWRVEPDIPRVATGVKNRVGRLKCLGNAVVPQQVYPILQAIAEIKTR